MPMFVAGLYEGKNIRKMEGSKKLEKDELGLFNLIAFKDMIIVSREYFLENESLIFSWAKDPKSGYSRKAITIPDEKQQRANPGTKR